MGVEKKFLRDQLFYLNNYYGDTYFPYKQEVFDVWYEIFKDFDEVGLKRAIEKYIQKEKYAPVPASIIYYYNILDKERKELGRQIRNTYTNIRSVWEEEYDKDTYKALMDYVMKQPKEQRINKLQDLKYSAISYAHDCDATGNTKTTIKEYIEHEC